jgi:hypothetical protein
VSPYPAEVLPALDASVPPAKIKRRARVRKPSRVGAVLSSALTWLCGCAVVGVAVTVAGVFILAGLGWSLITVGAFLFAIAGLIRFGIVNG